MNAVVRALVVASTRWTKALISVPNKMRVIPLIRSEKGSAYGREFIQVVDI
jgi:hypothetical protein